MGSPEAALPSLHALHAISKVALVITPPPSRAGRGRHLRACAVHQAALELGLPVEYLNHPKEALPLFVEAGVQLGLVCAYGRILPQTLLDTPSHGMYNLHFSLLPRWRGASPVQAALLAGDTQSGVSLQRMVAQLDAGPLVGSSPAIPLESQENAQQLTQRLGVVAARLLEQCWPSLCHGNPPLTPQEDARASFCRVITKDAGALHFAQEDALAISRKLRAYFPWPGCFCFAGQTRLRILGVRVVCDAQVQSQAKAWPLAQPNSNGFIRTAHGVLQITQVQSQGAKALPWAAFVRGASSLLHRPWLAYCGSCAL